MQEYITLFLYYLKDVKLASDNTIQSYERDLRYFLIYLEDIQIKDAKQLTDKHIKVYLEFMNNEQKSTATISRTLASIRALCQYLIREGIIRENPARLIALPKIDKKIPRILTESQITHLLEQPNVNDIKGIRDRAMLELIYATGIRVSELIGLKITDINLQQGYIICRDSQKERTIPIGKSAVTALNQYLTQVRHILLKDHVENALFVNFNGHQMTRQGFWKILKNYAKALNLSREITPHMLRHSFAAHLVQNGANLKSVQQMLGHSDIATTQVYMQLNKETEELKDIYNKSHPRA
ncbi:MAG: integrase family protein [Clostridia bacterium]|jgi:integrase/recombinase XerD|nr:integrase family protein [Clostridia bacterium]